MWQIRQLDPKTKKKKIVKKNFATKELADSYINDNMKDIADVWAEEQGGKKGTSKIDLTDKKGMWMWVLSPKKQEFFPYGIVIDFTDQFVKIQTKETSTEYSDLGDMRVERIKTMLEANTMKFETEGHFVVIKDYI
jgi:hypothetical protein